MIDFGINKKAKPLLFLVILHVLWFCAGLIWQNFYNGDSYEYIYLAENIKKGFYYGGNSYLPLEEFRLTLRTPVYALFILLSYTIFGYNTFLLLITQNILSILSCWLIYDVFQKINPVKNYAWLYWLLIAVYPAQFFFSDMIVPDILLQFFLMLYVQQLISCLYQKTAPKIGMMSLWLTLAALTKPIVYPFLALHLLFSLFFAIKNRRAILICLGSIPMVILISYGLWNQQRTGFFHISSIQSINLLDYNIRTFFVHKNGTTFADSFSQVEQEKLKTLPDLKTRYAYASATSKAVIKDHFFSYSFFHLRESGRFFIEPGKSELDLFTGYMGYDFKDKSTNFYDSYRKEGWMGAWRYLSHYPLLPILLLEVLFNIIRLFGWLLFLGNKRIRPSIRIAVSLFIIYFAVITGPVANTRYFLPVLLVMNGCAMLGYSYLLEQLKNRKKIS